MEASGLNINLTNIVLSAIPILILIGTIIGLKWSAPKSGALSLLAAMFIAYIFFGADTRILAIINAKGLSLSIFVLTIIWAAILLYNVIDGLAGIKIIGSTMTRLIKDPLMQALIVGWAFSGFIQGIAGLGVPVAIVSPILVLMGFTPVRAVSIVLIGHAWAVAFGSMGSSFYTIQLVTGIEEDIIGPHMSTLIILPTILTGFAVAHLQGGMESLRRGIWPILIIGTIMAASAWLVNLINLPLLAAIVPGLLGCVTGWIISKTPLSKIPDKLQTNHQKSDFNKTNQPVYRTSSFHFAFLPYYILFLFSILTQIPTIKELSVNLHLGLNYPSTVTSLGFNIDASQNYAKIRLFGHPAPLILISLSLTYFVLKITHRWNSGVTLTAFKRTYSQSASTSVGIITMIMMALVMTDTGMTHVLSQSIATNTESVFAIFSPFIGVLGTFITGSNTNSNVLFGALQLETATALSINPVTISSIQSIGGSLGSAIAPAKVLVGTAVVAIAGKENEVLRRTIPYCLLLVLIVGIQSLIVTTFFDIK